MFNHTFVQSAAHTRNPWSWAISFTGQCALVSIAMLGPMIYTEQIPYRALKGFLIGPPLPPPAFRPIQRTAATAPKAAVSQFRLNTLVMPRDIPERAARIVDDMAAPPTAAEVGVIGGIGMPTGSRTGVIGSIISNVPLAVEPPPSAEVQRRAATPPETVRIKVGGVIQAAKLVRQVQPIYPMIAKQARVSGTVRLHAIIAADGSMRQVRVLEGHYLLVPAALEAVKGWLYKPTLLNGEPVEVETQIDILFRLNG